MKKAREKLIWGLRMPCRVYLIFFVYGVIGSDSFNNLATYIEI